MSLTFGSGGGGSLAFSGAAPTPGGTGGANIEALERTGRRLAMLQTFAPELVNSSPEGALVLAEGPGDDDTLLRSATETVGYANVQRIGQQIVDQEPAVAAAQWANLPEWIQDQLQAQGFTPPEVEQGDGGRLFGSVPFVGDVVEAGLDWGEVPLVGGALEEVQHVGGEALQPVGQGLEAVLKPFAWLGEQPAHLYRSFKHIEQEQGGGFNIPAYFSPSNLARGWAATDKDDGYVRPGHRSRARELLGGDRMLYDIAHGLATGKTPEEIILDAGFEPGSAEAAEMAQAIATANADTNFQEAVHELSVGQVSFGRVVTQEAFGLDDTDSGWGRILSGTLDAGFMIASDPTLAVGRAARSARFGRHAFRLETAGDIDRMTRVTDLAMDLHRGRTAAGAPTRMLGGMADVVRPGEVRRARGVLNWADRVSEAFRTGEYARLSREVPGTSTALDAMVNSHVRRTREGLAGLDDAGGVLEWLKSRDGILGIAGTRLGGSSPMVRGLRMPTLTEPQRALLRTRGLWHKAIDSGRTMYGPRLAEITRELGNPIALTRQLGRWTLSHAVGDPARVLAGLTAHTPYEDVVPLFGANSVPEFTRLVNSGIFAGMDRPTMDAFVDSFAKGDLVTRANMVDQFNEHLFKLMGIEDTSFARRFLERSRQAYAVDGGDVIDVGGISTRGARLVDGQHADALAIPKVRDMLRESRRVNLTRMVFHNTPATWADAALGRAWKPAVLMRLGFIPRAAGEELLHFMLKHGTRTWMGAKGAEWAVQEELGHQLRAQLREAEELGQVDQVNRLRSKLAETEAFLGAPMRSLAAFTDRAFTRLFSTQVQDPSPWRRRWIEKGHALDDRGVVQGLERLANEISLFGSGVVHRLAESAHIPTRGTVGRWMAEHWNPEAADAARLMLEHPTVARAFAEHISGRSMTPWEFRRPTAANGAPVPKVEISGLSGGRPVVREVEMRPRPGQYQTFSRQSVGDDVTGYFHSIYTRQHRLRNDRVANRVLENALPRWVGSWGGDLSTRLGYSDAASLRRDLNELWSYRLDELPDEVGPNLDLIDEAGEGVDQIDGRGMLWAARKLLDDPEAGRGLEVWLGKAIDEAAAAKGLALDGRKVVATLKDYELDNAAQRWMAYRNVDPDRLVDDWGTLERQVRHVARGRLARPDMQPKLREMRRYSDERLAVPTAQGISKIYVPLVDGDVGALDEMFVRAAARRIQMIGGYGPEQAEAIARNAQAGLDGAREAATAMAGRTPLSAWGTADPRVADAVMGAVDEVTGVRTTFGILEVPDEVVQRAASDHPLGVRTQAEHWKVADDYQLDAWRLERVTPTDQHRRFSELEVDGEWWDDAALDVATTAYATTRPNHVRLYSSDRGTWTEDAPEGAFWFVDAPPEIVARYGADLPDEVVDELMAKRLPGVPEEGGWRVRNRQVGPGIGELEGIERVAESSLDEIFDILTTRERVDLDNDVLHEVIEPLLREDRVWTDAAGNPQVELGYSFDHLVMGTKWDRLPHETYGPVLAAAPDMRWERVVKEWFDGPVDGAISSIIRKPMFLHNFGQQLRNQRGLLHLFVDEDLAASVRASGLDEAQLDHLALALRHGDADEQITDAVGVLDESVELGPNELRAVRAWARQHNHGLDTLRDNALNRAMELTTPFIDDHNIRSAFQQYVGNMVPFQFAEEQFLKRWVRSASESPEMIRKAQLAMNGFRSMGVIRRDDRGQEVYVMPLVGDAVAAVSGPISAMFGDNLRIPYSGDMTGSVGYTLPGLSEQFGTPSVGPLVAMPLELLSRHFPELAHAEEIISGPGANRPVWSYFVPSWAGRVWQASTADVTQADMASATTQAIQTMIVNGQGPPENATPDEMQEFIERAQGQARTILMARGLLGMVSPAAPQWETKADHLNADFVEVLRSGLGGEEAIAAFLARHPDAEPHDLLAATVFTSETTYPGFDTPTEETFDWIDNHSDLVDGFPAATPWMLPHADADDPFSFRAWSQQVARGLRRRKTPQEFLDDIYYRQASRDYFERKTAHEADMLAATPAERGELTAAWNAWKGGYFMQHPVFERLLQDPARAQRRTQALDELTMLSAMDESPVPPELAEMVQRYRDYKLSTAGLRGDRRMAVTNHRKEVTQEFVAWAEWHVQRYPHLSGFWLGVIEPELRIVDEDAVTRSAA